MAKAKMYETSHETHKATRVAGLIVPLGLALYSTLAVIGVVGGNYPVNQLLVWPITLAWLGLAIYQSTARAKSTRELLAILIANHVLGIAYILFVSGAESPIVALWIVLLLATYVFAGRNGLYISILALFAAMIGEILLSIDNFSVLHLVNVGIYMLTILFIGVVAGAIITAQETSRQDLERAKSREELERERLVTLINNISDSILSTSPTGVIQLYNAASLGLLDTNSELRSKNVDDIVRLVDANNRRVKFERLFARATSVVSRDDLSAVISGETIRLNIVFSPIRSANSDNKSSSDGFIIIMRDITKQKSLEEERDEFISVISHELRTPLTVAEGSLSNAQVMMGRKDIPKATIARGIDMAHDQVVFLSRMVNDLSTLSRAERGVADDPELINVTDMIHALYNEYSPEAAKKGLKFDIDLPPDAGQVLASRLYLKEFLQNFTTNAIKYTKKGRVTVSVTHEGPGLRFSIEDTGIGLTKSDQTKIFKKFWRSEDYRTRETGGTGLGLYVAGKLASKLGTKIELSSRLNHGSTFSFVLPRASDN